MMPFDAFEGSSPYRRPATPESLLARRQTAGRTPEELAEDYRIHPDTIFRLMKDEKLSKDINGYQWPENRKEIEAISAKHGLGPEQIIAVIKFGPELQKRQDARERGAMQ